MSPYALTLAAAALLLTGCGPPTARDRENYQQFEARRPPAFADAGLIQTWRGFSSWEEDGTTRQCAVAVYEVSDDAIGLFEHQLHEVSKQAPTERQELLGWRLRAQRAQTDAERSDDPWSWDNQLVEIRTASSFCDMPEGRFAAFEDAVIALWGRQDAPALAVYDHHGGGVLGGPRKHRYFYGILNKSERLLYLWFSVYPSSGG